MKFILFSVIIGQVAIAKEIGGMVVQNKIQKGNLPSQYLIEQSNEEMIREQIDEEIIRAYDCMEESMSNAEISLNPPPECRIEDGSAYHRPIRKKAQILERVRRVPIEITTCVIQWRININQLQTQSLNFIFKLLNSTSNFRFNTQLQNFKLHVIP